MVEKINIEAPVFFLDKLKEERSLYPLLAAMLQVLKNDQPGARLFACGGIVRDLVLSLSTRREYTFKDLDLILEGVSKADVDRMLEKLRHQSPCIKNIDFVGESFPVWKLGIIDYPQSVDLALTRTEESFGSGHRDFEVSNLGVSIERDSTRRDFTMNSLYMGFGLDDEGELTTRLHDFHGGVESILSKVITCVGEPRERFREDPLRMLRAIRFRANLPGFKIGERTSGAIHELAPQLFLTISQERVAEELYKALTGDSVEACRDLDAYGIIGILFPEFVELNERARERIPQRTQYLSREVARKGNPQVVFSAFLLDLAFEELQAKMRRNLSMAKINSSLFRGEAVSKVARRTRLPGIKEIAHICSDILRLTHFHLLEDRDAVLEGIFNRYEERELLLSLYRANQSTFANEAIDFEKMFQSYPESSIEYSHLVQASGIPFGPHLQNIKLHLRQMEIHGAIRTETEARNLLNRLYIEDTHLIQEHISKLRRILNEAPAKKSEKPRLTGQMFGEVRWLLFSRPVRLIRAYHEAGLLSSTFPELSDAEMTVEGSPHHFTESFLNDTTLALSLLYEEEPEPTPVQILSLLFLDVGKSRTKQVRPDGTVTYYGHDRVGAEIAYEICRRLDVAESIASDVYFIIQNHNALIYPGGPRRFRKLMERVDESLMEDLLLVHKIDQMAKMTIREGKVVDEGQLDNYKYIKDQMPLWRSEIRDDQQSKRKKAQALLSGNDLMAENPAWGQGLPQGPEVGRLKEYIENLEEKGLVRTRDQAIEKARGRIVLYHILKNPIEYLEALRKSNLLGHILPEIDALDGLEQTSEFHTEDAYVHTILVLKNLPKDPSKELILSAVFHDIGKAAARTFDEQKGVYHFYGHEKHSRSLMEDVCRRFEWGQGDFEPEKLFWMIRNHMKAQRIGAEIHGAMKKVEKLLFSGDGPEGVPQDYREDLLAFLRADTLGAVPETQAIKASKLADYEMLERLVQEVQEELPLRAKEEALKKKIKGIWNGNSVIRHFGVSGPEIGKLLTLGQSYVRDRLQSGDEEVTEKEVLDYILGHCSYFI